MTTDELVRLIEQVQADIPWEHYDRPTIGMLASVAGVPTRTVESAIQTARLEGTPIITDGGIRVAQTAEEAFGLYRWLRARLVTQQRTAWAVRSQAMLMQRGERRRLQTARCDSDHPTLWTDLAA